MDAFSKGMERKALRSNIFTKWFYKWESSKQENYEKKIFEVRNIEFDIITCRALAKLTQIFNYSHHLTKQNTVFLLHKGINIVDEINEATKCWFFEHELIKNKLEENSFIIKINGLKKIN